VNENITLFCPATGVPPPKITWYRNGRVLDNATDDVIALLDDGWRLYIAQAEVSHASRYSCRAENIAGVSEKHFDLNVLGKFQIPPTCTIFILIYLSIVIYLFKTIQYAKYTNASKDVGPVPT